MHTPARAKTRSEDTYEDEASYRVSKRLAKCVLGKIVKKISEEQPSEFAEVVLELISAAACIRTFDDRVALTETLQRHKENFALLLQHMADSCKALFADVAGDFQGHRTNQRSFLE